MYWWNKSRCERLCVDDTLQGKIKALHRVRCKAKEKPGHF
jgi:hypothetical protein